MRIWPSQGLWGHGDFLRLWGAQVASAFGSRITRTALPIIAILSVDATPTELAVLSALGVAPGVLVGLLAGGRIDRTPKRPLLIGADLLRAFLILTVPLAACFGSLSMPQLYLVAAMVGAASALFQIADNTFLPTLIGKDRLVEGNAKLEATDSIAEAAGPGLAGILIQTLSAPAAMLIDAATYLWSAALLGRIRATEKPAAPNAEQSTAFADMLTGFRSCFEHPLVGATLVAEAIMCFFGGFFLSLYMLLALETLNLSPAAIGLIISVGGLGAFFGAMIATRLEQRLGTRLALLGALGLGQGANLFVAFSSAGGPGAVPLLVAQQLIGDAALGVYMIHAVSLRQRLLPEAVLGRANATFHGLAGFMLLAGALAAGPLASALGLPATLWIGSLGGLLAIAPPAFLAWGRRRFAC